MISASFNVEVKTLWSFHEFRSSISEIDTYIIHVILPLIHLALIRSALIFNDLEPCNAWEFNRSSPENILLL